MTAWRATAVVLVALLGCAGVVAVVLSSDRADAEPAYAVLGPVVVLSFVGTGLFATYRRPGSRVGLLMVLLGFSWFVPVLTLANSRLVYSFAIVFGGIWGGVFLHLIMSFPTGRLAPGVDRALVLAGYVLFTVGSVPAQLFASAEDMGCADCMESVLQLRHDEDVAAVFLTLQSVLYVALFIAVLIRLWLRWRRADALDRMPLTPVYACGLLTFLLVTAGTAVDEPGLRWAAFIATAMLPFAFLGGLLRSHLARLDAELVARLGELRSSRARLVNAGDAERRRLERDLHDGAQSRLVTVTLLLGRVRMLVDGNPEASAMLDQAQSELRTGLAELRELARGIHPAVLTERGLEPAIAALATRSPVPVAVDADGERLPAPVEIAAYFVVSEALTNVAKYSQASQARVTVRRTDDLVTVEIADDGIGGADAARGSGLRGLGDRVAALDGTLTIDSPAGGGTLVHVEIPCAERREEHPERYRSAPAG
jgi:signal transduction histidine kinase